MAAVYKEKEQEGHALLGASSSHRWLECWPSARVERQYSDRSSDFAAEGSLAHAIAAKKLKERIGQAAFSEIAEIRKLSQYLTGEMEEYTEEYADFVMSRFEEARERTPKGRQQPQIFIEQRLDYSRYAEGGFGTGDAVIVSHDTVEIIDLKYGKGVAVDARDNSQMKLYALGAMDFFDYAYDFKEVRMTIYQPRIGNISSWETQAHDIKRWGEETVYPIARFAWEGKGVRKSGEWCRFCRAKGDCPRFAADSVAVGLVNPNAERLTPSEISALLGEIPAIKDWVKAIEDRSLDMALQGTDIPGYKIVEGRSNRKITDTDRVASALRGLGAEDADIFRPRELKTLTDLEKIFGKKRFTQACGDYIEKPAGKPTLVPDGDKREAMNAGSDFEGIDI